MVKPEAASAAGGYLVASGTGKLHVDSLRDLTVYDSKGDVVDLLAVNETFSPANPAPKTGYVVIDVVTAAEASSSTQPGPAPAEPRHERQGIRLNWRQAEVVTRLLPILLERLGDEPTESTTSLAERMIASIPSDRLGQRWQELIGPFYSANDIATWRGVTRQNINKLRKSGKLLAAQPTNEKTLLFPAWQFGPEGQELPHLPEVVKQLGKAAPDEWAQALWLNQKTDRFEGRSAADLLKAGEVDRVLAAARSDAAGMAA